MNREERLAKLQHKVAGNEPLLQIPGKLIRELAVNVPADDDSDEAQAIRNTVAFNCDAIHHVPLSQARLLLGSGRPPAPAAPAVVPEAAVESAAEPPPKKTR